MHGGFLIDSFVQAFGGYSFMFHMCFNLVQFDVMLVKNPFIYQI